MKAADFERGIRDQLRADGWVAVRSAGSHGIVDVLAVKAGERPLLIQAKSGGRGPYDGFGPTDRAALRTAARRAGGRAELWWWPPRARRAVVVKMADWPSGP